MSSEVKANKLSPATGTDVVLGDASDTFTIPASATLDVSSATMTGFTIPSGQTLTVASSGEIDIASGATLDINGTADFTGATVTGLSAGLFSSYAIIADHKDDVTNGGTFTSGDWRTRDLQTEVADPDGIVSISSDQFTLGAGSYLIRWTCPVWTVTRHKSRLYNVTDTVAEGYGQSEVGYPGGANSGASARVVIAGSTVFEIQHRCETTRADDGFGVQSGFGVIEVYTIVEIFKEA